MTLDLREINAATKSMSWAMPNVQVETMKIEGSECLAELDLVNGYGQLPLGKNSQNFRLHYSLGAY